MQKGIQNPKNPVNMNKHTHQLNDAHPAILRA